MLTFSNRSNALFALLALTLAATTLAATPARALDYPTRPVELIVPFAAGGGAELLARLLSEGLNKRFGQAFLVINRPGANTNLGTLSVVRSKPDGYTLAIASVGLTANPSLYKSLAFEPQRDLDPITLIANSPTVLVVPPSLPVNTLPEFIAYAKARPGALNYGTYGAGSGPHLATELFQAKTGIRMQAVPYGGGGPAALGAVTGQVQALFSSVLPVLGLVRGDLIGLDDQTGRSIVVPVLVHVREERGCRTRTIAQQIARDVVVFAAAEPAQASQRRRRGEDRAVGGRRRRVAVVAAALGEHTTPQGQGRRKEG